MRDACTNILPTKFDGQNEAIVRINAKANNIEFDVVTIAPLKCNRNRFEESRPTLIDCSC